MSWLPKSPKARRRLWVVAAVAPILALAVGLSLWAMQDSVTFFYSPSEATADKAPQGRNIRLGGLVETGSVEKTGDGVVAFTVTDNAATTRVVYHGDLPDLFREGQGIVAQGAFGPDRVFHASQVLAKHDENYMPREVADRIKAKGEWRPEAERSSRPQAGSAQDMRSSRPQAGSATEHL
ncbi:cytochrome c maturation protein CcmE [Brevundimonas sp.]|jgi:cytochrome c-type biogenesis protein CcmE|uniref:cytochrome c maturation protein CcmE n=1 Tax=Brevundimonas sp. TaxID=1871086 RepID=UPI0017BE3543|nr:cytochrome c maturation protein CcmE [Brevundimonas sp.]MBA4807927.1 cytochrome c maturation protein CcmE [Brevundimonas sp.]